MCRFSIKSVFDGFVRSQEVSDIDKSYAIERVVMRGELPRFLLCRLLKRIIIKSSEILLYFRGRKIL